ncbi:MAG TPA: methyltransferase domain-containing protein, partial [Magnetospirillaceae bacterium]|nr:methyltransferase domain-containing protein [Magnetospirillaceae bacterium]
MISRQSPDRREIFVEELAALCGIRDVAILNAFRTVPREDFLPPGPWTIEGIDGSLFLTPDDNPSHIQHAVGVVLKQGGELGLHCANPAPVAKALQNTGFRLGDRVLHVGAGLGYVSALIAELIGPSGRAVAAEIDPSLAASARRSLAPWPYVEVAGDALALAAGSYDVIFSSAGMATIPTVWLDSLAAGGRMMVPLTGTNGSGFTFHFRRIDDALFEAKLESFVRFYPCLGLRDSVDLLRLDKALASGLAPFVTAL